jgi:hypothetical protein
MKMGVLGTKAPVQTLQMEDISIVLCISMSMDALGTKEFVGILLRRVI